MKIWKTSASLVNLSSKFVHFTTFHLQLKAAHLQLTFLFIDIFI